MNTKRLLLLSAVVWLLSMPAFAAPKKADFPLSLGLYSEVLGHPDDKTYHCFYAGPNSGYDHNIACPEFSNTEVHLYAVGLVNGQKHLYRIELTHGENLPSLPLHPDVSQPLPPINNVFPARLDGKKGLQILASRGGKLVTVKAVIVYEE